MDPQPRNGAQREASAGTGLEVTTLRNGLLSAGAVLLTASIIAGCSGGSSGGAVPTETGEVTVAVTDAATDEVDVLEVDIVSFRFVRPNGATVEILPQTVRVDFAQLVSVSQVIAGATLPVGPYTSAYMTLDFSTASVRISGNTSSASLVDSQGQPLSGREELQIVLPGGGFVVGRAHGHFAEIDFDLDQSLTVDAASNQVTVDTILYARIDPATPKPLATPGLTSDFTGTSFKLDMRHGLGLVSRGELTVHTGPSTAFDLGGQVLQGQAGYDALKALGDGTLIVAGGIVDPARRAMGAGRVVVLPQNLDEVGGLVVARSAGPGQDTTLTLRGVAVRRSLGSVTFNDTVTITTSLAETKVGKRGMAAGSLDTDAINVGQRILAYGTFTSGSLDLTQPGAGFVRMVMTDVAAAALGPVSGGQLDVDVVRIGRRPIAAFDFDVNGVAQADPTQLAVDTGALPLASVTTGSPVVALGFFEPVSGTVRSPAFKADTIIDRTDAGSLLRMAWLPGSNTAITVSGNDLSLDAVNAQVAKVDHGLIVPITLSTDPTVTGNGGSGFYAVRRGLTVSLFSDFASFKAHVEGELAAGARVLAFTAIGRYDATGNQLTAARAVAFLN